MHIYHHARSAAHSDKLILHSVRAHILRHDLWSYAYAGIDNNIFFKNGPISGQSIVSYILALKITLASN